MCDIFPRVSVDEGIDLISEFIRSEYIPIYRVYIRPYRKAAEAAASIATIFEANEINIWELRKYHWMSCKSYLRRAISSVRFAEHHFEDESIIHLLSCIPEKLNNARECLMKIKKAEDPPCNAPEER